MRTRSLSILATTATLAALLGCPLEGLQTPDAASIGAEYDSTGSVANSPNHDDAVDAAEDVSWAEQELPAGSSALRVLMTDAPVEADSVFVTFCGISVAPAAADVGAVGRNPGVSSVPRGEPGAGGASDGRDSGAAGAPAEPSRSGAGGDGAGGAAGAPAPDDDDGDKAEAERAEAERAAGDEAAGDEAAPMDSEAEAAEREAAEGEAAEREAANGGASGGQGTDAVAPRPDVVPSDGWQPINQECQTLDLLTLRDGVTEAIGVATLAPGRYGQIRLMLVDASIVVDGVEHELEVPSGMESGLKINGGFELLDGGATTITLDFDAGSSVQFTEGSGYRLTPVINVIDVISHDDGSGAEAREPAVPGTEPRRDAPPQGGAGGAGGDGAGGRALVPPPPPPSAEPPPAGDAPPPPPPEQPKAEPSPEEPPPADEPEAP